ncbi:MAG: MATE family efflux transporter [Oscillospiraceae bacterium]|nr:MATE family efflux transporter [Oscillospiraceae bacterium]
MSQGKTLSTAELHYNKMTGTPVSKLILRLGMPTTVSMLITSIYNMADTYFVGTLGESAQAATGILFALQSIIQGIAFMLGHGSGSLLAKSLAKKDTQEASTYVSTAFFTGGAVGLVITTLGLLLLTPLVRLLGSTETIVPYARDYGMWILLACPFMICSLILNNNLRFEGKAFYAMFGLTTGGLLNIFGDYLLVKVVGLGVYGAGMATAVSQVVSFTILLIMYRNKAQGSIRLSYISKKFRDYLDIMRVGLPSLIRQGLTAISGSLLNNLTKPFGDVAIAAMSVVNRYSMFVMCVGLGIGQGFQPVAAFNYEAGRKDRVRKGLLFTMSFSAVFMALMCLVTMFYAEGIVTLFQKLPKVVEIGARAMRYAAVGLLFMPLSIPVNMLYQSIRKAGIASVLSTLRSGAILIPVLLIGVPILGLQGIQLAQPLSDCITGLISIPFILHFLRKDR